MRRNIGREFLRILYPPHCHFCQQAIEEDHYLCGDCSQDMGRVEVPFCQYCGESYDGVIEAQFRCPNCSSMELAYGFARASLVSSEASLELVHGLKYQKQRHLARALAFCMAEVFENDERFRNMENWCLVPIPLHWKRQWRRGFNQSEALAEELSKLVHLPVRKSLKRVRSTKSQTRLSRNQRLENLRGAVCLRSGYEDLQSQSEGVILVDDVFTTGATVNACAAILRKQFPRENIVVLTAVRG